MIETKAPEPAGPEPLLPVGPDLKLRLHGVVDDIEQTARLTLEDRGYFLSRNLDFLSDYSLEKARQSDAFVRNMIAEGNLLDYRVLAGSAIAGCIHAIRSTEDDRTAVMGFYRYSPYRGLQYIARAAPVLMDYARRQMVVDRFEYEVLPDNLSSIRTVQALGARLTSVRREDTISGITRTYDVWEAA